MVPIRTQIATIADLEVVASLFDAYRQFYDQASNLPLATNFIRDRMLQNQSIILLARDEANKALGFCQLYPTYSSKQSQFMRCTICL